MSVGRATQIGADRYNQDRTVPNSSLLVFALSNITPLFHTQEPSDAVELPVTLNSQSDHESCLFCGKTLLDSDVYSLFRICPNCHFHYSIPARTRVETLADPDTFKETSTWIQSLDPLSFSTRESYRVRLLRDQTRTGLTEAALTGTCTIGGTPTVLIVLDFGFFGGSMGLVVGEKVALAMELATRKRCPVVAVITSGGARIQEGVLSLMQMAKTVIAVNTLHNKGLPLVSVLGNPATGQTLASFASMADVMIAEPGAHIGFAPFRSVEEASGPGISSEQYSSEQYFKNGLIDRIVDRTDLKHELASVLDLLSPFFKLTAARKFRPAQPRLRRLEPWQMVQLSRHHKRPKSRDYLPKVFANFLELHGDRLHCDDPSVVIGVGRLAGESIVVLAQQKFPHAVHGSSVATGPPKVVDPKGLGGTRPEGFRKAQRAIALAARFKLPIVTLVDTTGPELDLEAEHQGLASSISSLISVMSTAPVPTVSVLIGEGGSEAALAFSVADRILMMQNAIYTPISSENAAEIEMRDPGMAEQMSHALKLTSVDCRSMGIVDRIVPEPEGGAHTNPNEAARLLKLALMRELTDLQGTFPLTLVRRRHKKFRKVGEYGSRFRSALLSELRVWQSAVTAGVKALGKGKSDEAVDDPKQ